MDANTKLQMCLEQERDYQFPRFGREQVWELGCDLVKACEECNGPLAIEIDINGTMVFRYYPAGTGPYHEMWLERKRRTVQLLEKSTLRLSAELELKDQEMYKHMGLDPMEYTDSGGGFPLRMKDGCIFGFVGISGLSGLEDHTAVINGLARYFKRNGWGAGF